MQIPRVTFQFIGGVLLLFIVMAAIWMKQAEPLAIVHCADGSVLRIEAVTMGTNHVWKTKFPAYIDRSPWRRMWLTARDAVRLPSKRLRKAVPFEIPTPLPCLMIWGHCHHRGQDQFEFSIIDRAGKSLDTFSNSVPFTSGQFAGPISGTTNIHRSSFLRILVRKGTNSLGEFEVKNRL